MQVIEKIDLFSPLFFVYPVISQEVGSVVIIDHFYSKHRFNPVSNARTVPAELDLPGLQKMK